MNKKTKFGFTLAEVLMAACIAGVIAAITIPTLTTGVQSKKLSTLAGVNVNDVENGCQKLIQYASERSTTGSFNGHYKINSNLSGSEATSTTNSISGNNLWTGTGSFFNITSLSDTEKTNYNNNVKAFDGGTASPAPNTFYGSNLVMHNKTGAYWGVSGLTENTSYEDPIVSYIYIDVNGINSPNRYGKDIFLYGLTDACHMIPAGSDRINAINSNVPKEDNGCKTSVTNGLSCTSRVVREGYKISY